MKRRNRNEIIRGKAVISFNDNGKALQELMEEAFMSFYITFVQFDSHEKYDIFMAGR